MTVYVYSKSFLANQWHQIDKEWAVQLVGLCMKVCGSWWNVWTEEEKRTFYGCKIKEYNHDLRRCGRLNLIMMTMTNTLCDTIV